MPHCWSPPHCSVCPCSCCRQSQGPTSLYFLGHGLPLAGGGLVSSYAEQPKAQPLRNGHWRMNTSKLPIPRWGNSKEHQASEEPQKDRAPISHGAICFSEQRVLTALTSPDSPLHLMRVSWGHLPYKLPANKSLSSESALEEKLMQQALVPSNTV